MKHNLWQNKNVALNTTLKLNDVENQATQLDFDTKEY